MRDNPAGDALPVLVVASELTTSLAMRLAHDAEGLCRLLFVRDASWSASATTMSLLGRLGEVITVDRLEELSAAARVAGARPAGIAAFHDHQLEGASQLASRLGLPFHRPEVAARLTDKELQRAAFQRAGLEVPAHLPLGHGAPGDVARGVGRSGLRFPLVLKPRRGTASHYTVRTDDVRQLEAALWRLPAGDRIEHYLVEEYLPDAQPPRSRFAGYVSVESVLDGTRVTHVALTGRREPAWPFRETGLFVPSDLSAPDAAAVLELAGRAALALGCELGVLHTEIKLTPAGPRLIEVNGRVGGAVPELIEAAGGGLSLTRASMEVALGRRFGGLPLRQPDRIAFKVIHQPPAEAVRVRSVSGLEQVSDLPGVSEVYLNRGPGAAVDWRRGFEEFVFHVGGTAADHEQLARIDRAIGGLVKVQYETHTGERDGAGGPGRDAAGTHAAPSGV